MNRHSKYSPEVRERAVRLVREQRGGHASEWAVIQSIASKIGCTPEALRLWTRQAERDRGDRPGLTTTEKVRLAELERENRKPKRANEIPRKAAAFFAQAELDRRPKRSWLSSTSAGMPKRNKTLEAKIQGTWECNFRVHGARKVLRQLQREQWPVARCSVER